MLPILMTSPVIPGHSKFVTIIPNQHDKTAKDVFLSLPDLTTTRWGHGCGAINAQDGSGNRKVVAAGDLKGQDDSVEIYSIADNSWRSGKIDFKEQNVQK